MDISRYIDYTLLTPDATMEDIAALCQEAVENDFYSVCVQPYRVFDAVLFLREELNRTTVCTVVGFPLGANFTSVKVKETEDVLEVYPDCEIDMVMNLGAFKDKNYSIVENEIKGILSLTPNVKVIIQTGVLTPEEIIRASKIVSQCGAKFVKTSTGMVKSSRAATVEDILLIKEAIQDTNTKIKASAGIKDYETAKALIEAGASRLGTSVLIKSL